MVNPYLATLKTFRTMAVDDVLPLSDLLSDDLLSSFFDEVESSSSTALLTVPVPAPPPENDFGKISLPPSSAGHSSASVLDDGELKLFLTGQRNSNTERKTKSDLNVWHTWCRSVGEKRPIADIPPAELNKVLAHFFTKVKKRDGTSYELRCTLNFNTYTGAMHYHHHKGKRRAYLIKSDSEDD